MVKQGERKPKFKKMSTIKSMQTMASSMVKKETFSYEIALEIIRKSYPVGFQHFQGEQIDAMLFNYVYLDIQ